MSHFENSHNSGESKDSGDEMAVLLEGIQPELRAYVGCLLGAPSDLCDVLQEVNIFVWEKRDEFELGTAFKAWVFKIAYFKVMANRRDRARRKKFVFNDELLVELAEDIQEPKIGAVDLSIALVECLKLLNPEQREIIDQHYLQEMSIADIAHVRNKKVMAIYKAISRIRTSLRGCIERKTSVQ